MRLLRATVVPLLGLALWVFASDKTLSGIGALIFIVSGVTAAANAWERRRRSKQSG
jgi:hypothetical protein